MLNDEKMRKDLVERFSSNVERCIDEFDEADPVNLTNVYSNFYHYILSEDDINDKDVAEDMEFISNELKKIATEIFENILNKIIFSQTHFGQEARILY